MIRDKYTFFRFKQRITPTNLKQKAIFRRAIGEYGRICNLSFSAEWGRREKLKNYQDYKIN